MTPEQRPSASAPGLGRSIRARLRVGRGVARRVGVAGALLASFLVATSWLVSPAPQLDGTYLRFLAISTTCEMLLWFAIVLVTRRVFVSSALCGLIVGAVIVTSNLKHEYTAVAALPIDAYAAIGIVYDLSTFVGYVELHIVEVSALVVLCGLVVLGFLKERVLFAWSRRTLAIGAVYVAAITWFYYPVTSRDAPIQRLYRTAGAEFNGEHPNDSVVELGLFAHLLVAALEFFPELPIDYGDRDLFLEHFQATAATGPPTPASSPQPNIVVVLSESLFDPRGLNVSIEPTVLTELDELAKHADYHGTLRVHTIGGGTVRVEYSLLTGIPTSIIGQGGQWPFSSLVTESTWSLAKHLKSIGYRTVAVYPAPGSLFNARRAYRLLGRDLELRTVGATSPAGDHPGRPDTSRRIVETDVQPHGPVFPSGARYWVGRTSPGRRTVWSSVVRARRRGMSRARVVGGLCGELSRPGRWMNVSRHNTRGYNRVPLGRCDATGRRAMDSEGG